MTAPPPQQPHPAQLQPNQLSDHAAPLPVTVAARNAPSAELEFLAGLE